MSRNLKVGKDSVVIGNISGNIGENCVVIGATDTLGNTILNKSMAIGKNTYASEGSIAIGTNASAGARIYNEKLEIINILRLAIENTKDKTSLNQLVLIVDELQKDKPDKNLIKSSWEILKNFGSINGIIGLGEKLNHFLLSILP